MSQQLRDQLQATLSGTHTLERELGGGGMSKVFVAEELRLKRKVVVKVLSPELAQGISIERFEREIQTVAALQQANIVPVLTAGDTQGLPYYTMPFIEGESLRARLAGGPMPVTEVIGVMRDVARALAYAHQRGVVHRDIKPDNVLMSGGAAVVTDFGIAKAISASRTESGGNAATLTQLGTSIGTPAYMAPEQAAGDPGIDHRADIYSLGAMAYELLSGQSVFAGRTPQRMLAAHMSETPTPITEFRGDLPQSLAELVMHCLSKEAGDRPQQAGDIVRVLETITSGSGMQSVPPVLLGGAAMFRKALAIYAGAFVAVAIFARAAIVGIGLPDWVFPGSLIVMALGLPVVLWTGYVQRVARRAFTMTPTYTPGGTPSLRRGTIQTMALKAAPKMSWHRTARGGMYAMGGFVALIAGFMVMRSLGIGPFGSLIASGDLASSNRLVITDFTVSNGDSALGRVVGEAIRAGLSDSRVFNVLTPTEVAGALQRMQRPGARLSLEVARQVALREGVKALIDGDVTLVGTSYIVAARLMTADSGRELASFRGTASSSDAIIDVADEISRKLRARTGESLKRVQATRRLAYATTSSLEALRKYSEGARANDITREYPTAIRLLREAVALDSNFAEGWRKLAVALRNYGRQPPSQADSAIRRAFALSGRMSERERDVVLAYYYGGSPGYDRGRAMATYQRMLLRGDSTVGVNNLALMYNSRREFAKAESLFRVGIAVQAQGATAYENLIGNLDFQGKWKERDSVLAVALAKYPAVPAFKQRPVSNLLAQGRFADYVRAMDSARKAPDPRSPTFALNGQVTIARTRGRIRETLALMSQVRAVDSSRGEAPPLGQYLATRLSLLANRGLPFDAELRAFDAEIAKTNIETLPLPDRPYLPIANMYAGAGQAEKAKAWLARYRREVHDTALLRFNINTVQSLESELAVTEKRWSDAVSLARQAARRPDGPASSCAQCLPLRLLDIFLEAGMPDSAIAAYQDYRKTPRGSRPSTGPDFDISPWHLDRLGEAFVGKGDTTSAVQMYAQLVERWKDADPELQPRVAAAKKRLTELTPVERPRR